MEESDELRAMVVPSEPANGNLDHSQTREEGELCSDDDAGENIDRSTIQPTPAGGSVAVTLVQIGSQGIHGGSKNIPSQTTGQSISQKSSKKNQLLPKSSPWSTHAGTDKNLVISFSDDDSGSDSEVYKQDKVVESKGNTSRSDSSIKPPISLFAKSNKLQQNARSVQKAMPKRLSLNRPFISSMTKVHGTNYKGAGSFPVVKGSIGRNFNPLNKNVGSRERGYQGVALNDNKVKDLRQQIALRESELKLKAAQQNKESASVLGRYQNSMKLKNDSVRKSTPVSLEAGQLEPKEPDRKRLKLGASCGATQASGGELQIPAAKLLSSKDSTWGKCNLQERNMVNHRQKEIPSRTGESTLIKSQMQPEKHLDNALHNMSCRSRDGVDVSYGCNQTEKNSRLIDPSVAFNRSAVPTNMTSNDVPKNLEISSHAVCPNCNGNANASEHSIIDLQSLFGMQELIDKELEEVQEHRHNCEIEERNALKVYLKAQRALLEANSRCTNLYRKRELYSSKLQSLILSDSNSSWSLGQHEQFDMGLNYLPMHGNVIPTSSCQRQGEYKDINHPDYGANNQGVTNERSNISYNHMTGANLGSEPCSEPDASTSEPFHQRGINPADGVYSPLDESDTFAENEAISPSGHVSTLDDVEYHRKQDSKAKPDCIDNPQDSLLLEATLRSELFARLGTRASKDTSGSSYIGPAAGHGAENEVGSEKIQLHHHVVPFSREEENDIEGNERHDKSVHLDPVEIQSQQNIGANSLNPNYSTGSRDQHDLPCQGDSTNKMSVSPLIFRSAFSQLKEMLPFNSKQFQSKNKLIEANDNANEKGICLSSEGTQWGNKLSISMPVTAGNLLSEESSYSCCSTVDPFWPLCMYELRGKCNNDDCPWQHVKNYCDGNIYQHQHTDSNNDDSQGGLTLHQHCNGVTGFPKYHKAIILPTYLVGLDVLKADQFASKSIMACRNTQCWKKFFSITLVTSNLLPNGLSADSSLLHGGDERIEVHGTWSKQFSSFKWRSEFANQIKQAMVDSEQAVEMALLMLNQEINELQGVRKALSVLSKALETDPTSVVLWIVYLLIYYGTLKLNEKDDMFLYAVKYNEGSYALWLMYINSRRHLDDRLAAYDTALSVLCRCASAPPMDGMLESACILDLFLQMLDCLCMSGNVEGAIQRSYGVLPATTKSDEPHHLSLSDILNCLTIFDKCVFWVCCIYLVIYRKLPDAVIQKFECEKDLLDIEWPLVLLSEDDKKMAVELVETAVESVDSFICTESVKGEANLRSAQLFALNHIRCMIALDSLECLRSLLDKYVKLYPSCIELVLVSAHIQRQEIGVDGFIGFEEAISRWPKEVPGVHCIWNQYIENAIQSGRIDLAKEITVRWFNSGWLVQDLPNGGIDAIDGDDSCGSLGLNTKFDPDAPGSDNEQLNLMFGFLNLSLYNLFQNDEREACIAVDNARKVAIFKNLEQCMIQQAMFLLCDASSLKDNDLNSAIKKILDVYMDDSSQAFLVPKVLTRRFVENIKKPRIQHLTGNILSPISFDCSLLNLILQSWFGSSLLPQTISDPKHLVDFVEAILEVAPYNFQLAIAVCKLLRKGYNSADQTSASLWFWACSTLVNTILYAIPIPPQYVWVEVGVLLHNVTGIEAITERFYRRALSVYPFSVRLWRCFYELHKTIGNADDVIEAAKERGIQLNCQ